MLNYFILRLISMRCSSANHNLKLSMPSNEEDETQLYTLNQYISAESSKNSLSLATSSERTTALYLSPQISKDYTTYDMLPQYEEETIEGNLNMKCFPSEKKNKLIPETSRLFSHNNDYFTDNDNPVISHLVTKNLTESTFPVIIEETEKSKAFYNNKRPIYQNEAGKITNETLYQDEPRKPTSKHTNSIELTSDINYNNGLGFENKTFKLHKPELKRKSRLIQEFNNTKKQHMLNTDRWEPNQTDLSWLKMLLKSSYNAKINRPSLFPSNMLSSKFLRKYDVFLTRIQILLEIFLNLKLENEKNIYKVLYAEDFSILNGFSFDLFGNMNMQQPDILKKASSTADMLVNFFEILDFEDFEDLIFELKKCLELKDELNVEVKISNGILFDIFAYLRSEESRYLKSFSVEFYSFAHKFNELAISNHTNLIKSFAMFLILVKRNNLIIPRFKEKLFFNCDKLEIREFFQNQVVFSSSLFFVFIKYLPSSNPGNIVSNMCTSILFSCISKQMLVETSSDLFHIDVIHILRYVFFDLMQFKVFEDYNKIFEFEKTPEILTSIFPNLNTNSKEILLHIQSEFLNILERIKSEINLKKLSETQTIEKFELLNGFNNFNIYQLRLLLEYLYTFSNYTDCYIQKFLINR